MRCGHCGFSGNLLEKAITTVRTHEYASPDGFHEYEWYLHARVMQCPGCEDLTFYTYRECHYQDPDDWPIEVLYPHPPEVDDLPDKVRVAYEQILPLKVSNPAAFVVGIGNVIAAICNEQGITKKSLSDLPGALGSMADHLHMLRNRGAHGDPVDADDARVAADLISPILDYYYRHKAMLQRAQSSIAAASSGQGALPPK